MRSYLGLIAAWLAMVLIGAPVFAQNLVLNPYFDTGLGDWDSYEPGNGILLWSNTMDAGGSAVLGSASIGIFAGNYVNFGISQCVPVEGGELYRFGASYYLSIDAGTDGLAESELIWFDGLGCTGNVLGVDRGNRLGVGDTGSWHVSVNGDAEAPATAQSADLLLLINKGTGSGLVSAYLDRAFLETILIFADGFENGGLTAWDDSTP